MLSSATLCHINMWQNLTALVNNLREVELGYFQYSVGLMRPPRCQQMFRPIMKSFREYRGVQGVSRVSPVTTANPYAQQHSLDSVYAQQLSGLAKQLRTLYIFKFLIDSSVLLEQRLANPGQSPHTSLTATRDMDCPRTWVYFQALRVFLQMAYNRLCSPCLLSSASTLSLDHIMAFFCTTR